MHLRSAGVITIKSVGCGTASFFRKLGIPLVTSGKSCCSAALCRNVGWGNQKPEYYPNDPGGLDFNLLTGRMGLQSLGLWSRRKKSLVKIKFLASFWLAGGQQ
jgi:hypothetical protein